MPKTLFSITIDLEFLVRVVYSFLGCVVFWIAACLFYHTYVLSCTLLYGFAAISCVIAWVSMSLEEEETLE